MTMTEHDWATSLEADFIEVLPQLREDRDWQDTVAELADNAVPIYTHDRVALWLDMNCPEIDDDGLIESGLHDVVQIIGVVIYEQASQRLHELARNADLD